MNPDLQRLQPYPFERLAQLKQGIVPPASLSHIALSIGEPKHPAPPFVIDALRDALHTLGTYPAAAGTPELKQAAASWLERRFRLPPGTVDAASMVLPVNGTREALFAFAQAIVDRSRRPLVLMPNPFYQIYEGAALLAGAEPVYLNTDETSGFVPDLEAVSAAVWERCQLLFLCSPGNPTGAVLSRDYLRRVIALADKYDFVIAADECYADIYPDEQQPPPGLLEVCASLGRPGFERCVVFHSLSKRSSVPGLRSGFVAGDAAILKRFLLYRTYHGCAMSLHTQLASIPAWNDDAHAVANRTLYRQKFAAVVPLLAPVLDVQPPDAAFYLWPRIAGDDAQFARGLYAQQNVTVLPGSYLGRDSANGNPGSGRLRISLVAPVPECIEAATRIRAFIEHRGDRR